jgi:hypothetical protein
MGCNCGKGNAAQAAGPSSYTVRKPDGTTVAYRSKVEAEAAAKRTGGNCTNC